MKDIIIIGDAYWADKYWCSRHHVAQSLAKKHRVVFIEKAPTLISPLVYRDIPWSRVFKGGILQREGETFYRYSPQPRFPFDRRYRMVGSLNQVLFARELRALSDKLGFTSPLIISFDYKVAGVFERTPKATTCYYCVDNIVGFPWPMADMTVVRADEYATAQAADLVITTSSGLTGILSPHSKRIETIGHGIDLSAFEVPVGTQLSKPADIAELPGPIFGFVGKFEEWVDVDLIAKAAVEFPSASFVLIGPWKVDPAGVALLPNVHRLGPKPKSQLREYINCFDVGLIPFKVDDLTNFVNPLKLYEYFALGKPVVSTYMPEVAKYASYGAYCANSHMDFIRMLSVALQDSQEQAEERRNLVQSMSWDHVADQIIGYFA